jgi:hypothetical protein
MDEWREGFKLKITELGSADAFAVLGQQAQRAFTVCYLFLNEHRTISEVATILKESRQNVILTLLHQGILDERRRRPRLQMTPDQGGH